MRYLYKTVAATPSMMVFRNFFLHVFVFFSGIFSVLATHWPLQNGKPRSKASDGLYKITNMGSAVVVPSTKSKTWLKKGGARSPQTNPSLGFCRGAHFPFAHVFHFVVAAFGNQVEVGASRRPAVWNLVVARLCQAIQNTGSRPVRAHPKRDQFWIL